MFRHVALKKKKKRNVRLKKKYIKKKKFRQIYKKCFDVMNQKIKKYFCFRYYQKLHIYIFFQKRRIALCEYMYIIILGRLVGGYLLLLQLLLSLLMFVFIFGMSSTDVCSECRSYSFWSLCVVIFVSSSRSVWILTET